MRIYSIFSVKKVTQRPVWALSFYQKVALLIITTAITTNAFAQSYYSVLGLPENAPLAQVKTAYRKLAMKYHPDRNAGADSEEKFKAIKHAYEKLSNDPASEAGASHLKMDELFEKFNSSQQLSAPVLAKLILNLGDVYFDIVSSSNSSIHQNFLKALDLVTISPSAQAPEVIEALLRLDTIQDFTFGMHPDLDAHNSLLPLDAVSKTLTEILDGLQFTTPLEAKHFLANLASYTSKSIRLPIGNFKQSYAPKLNPKLGTALLAFGVRHDMITDAESLLAFHQTYATHLLDDRQRETPLQILLRAQPLFVMSLLKSANIFQAQTIIGSLYGTSQGMAYEEWMRAGLKSNATADQILALIKKSRTYADHWLNNRFGGDYAMQAQTILNRIHAVNLTVAADFHKLNPTKEQITLFIQLSDFKNTEYTFSRLLPNQLGPRDYTLQFVVPQAFTKLATPRAQGFVPLTMGRTATAIKCIGLFK